MSRKTRTPIDLAATAERLAATRDLWQPLVDFDPISRYYAQLTSDPDHEAWLLTWLPGQGTDWHDHGNSAGSFVVLQGHLTEELASSADVHGVRRILDRPGDLGPGSQRSFGHHYVHRVTNTSLDPAVSLHVYSPKLTTMRTYAVAGDRLHLAELQRAGVTW
ncbi:Cysteine dioxygenase type I [Nostocoides japonicum T1-X7]|uniref:Cysteine dioxygenase type I n=1 Tax=Nostocoides japonicum T1-X7 TaxID=1194083 RepID=A0A077LV77_9MICO|nr:cysteine dioxygenase family protein [Tetrasphaera japonica]CCH76652.1 Cysteine dioxygenase type I [Tetrasphaera japonica T1-X7]